MKLKTIEQLQAELENAEKQAERMADARLNESRVIALMVAAGLISEEKVEAARKLVRCLK